LEISAFENAAGKPVIVELALVVTVCWTIVFAATAEKATETPVRVVFPSPPC